MRRFGLRFFVILVALFAAELKSLASLAAPSGSPLLAFSQAKREAIAPGYQLGALIVPSVLPVAMWVAFNGIPAQGAKDWRAPREAVPEVAGASRTRSLK